MPTATEEYLLERGFEETFKRFAARYKPEHRQIVEDAKGEFRCMFFAGANYLQELIAALQSDAVTSGKMDVFNKSCVLVEKECKGFRAVYPEVAIEMLVQRETVPKVKQ